MPVPIHPLFGDAGETPPSSVLDFELAEISVDEAMRLNDIWHSILPDTNKGNLNRNKHKAFYALHYDGRYYAVGIWTDPIAGNRFNEVCIELRRLAICNQAPKNTATRMLRLMREDLKKRFPHIKKVISYQAIDHHFGTIYKADNWSPAATSKHMDWHVKKGVKNAQTKSDKIRWERYL